MEPTFRASMNLLHTWAGVVLGGVLLAIFWMGTLSVFDREIDRWMAPMTRLTAGKGAFPSERLRPFLAAAAAAKAPSWFVILPTEREPTIRVRWRGASGPEVRTLDPASGAVLPEPETLAGTRFLYPFHYMLHIRLWQLGYWIVGLAAMAMLVLCVSGVIVHRKIFADFFTFRADRKPRRLLLDLHNVAGVLGFPFHIAIALSGLIIFFSLYVPSAWQVAYGGDQRAFNKEAFDTYQRPKLGKPGGPAALDAVIAEARRLWNGDVPRSISVRNPGDAAAYVQAVRPADGAVGGIVDVAYLDVATGALLHQRTSSSPVMSAQRFVAGLHLIQFRHWTLRWLYFGLGLVGCLLIATGYLFWLESRRKRHAQLRLKGVRLVEGLAVGSVTGIVTATLAFLTVNRLLPLGTGFAGNDRAALEVWAFYLVWLATFGHAWLRPRRAWIGQCRAIAALAVAAVLLNWVTTGDHLLRSLAHRHLWAIAGIDLVLLTGACVAAWMAVRLGERGLAITSRFQRTARPIN